MGLHPNEEAILRAFVAPNRRDRMLTLFAHPKARKKALDRLNHFCDWNPRCVQQIAPSASLETIAAQLRACGASERCRLISDNPGLDGRDMALEDALTAADTASFASLLCCRPSVVAFFFDETWKPRIRTLLRLPGPARS
jgi:hypothetical protein